MDEISLSRPMEVIAPTMNDVCMRVCRIFVRRLIRGNIFRVCGNVMREKRRGEEARKARKRASKQGDNGWNSGEKKRKRGHARWRVY